MASGNRESTFKHRDEEDYQRLKKKYKALREVLN
jgi:hypothetical protein